jgi:hypothetical protein
LKAKHITCATQRERWQRTRRFFLVEAHGRAPLREKTGLERTARRPRPTEGRRGRLAQNFANYAPTITNHENKSKAVLKWVGGKGQLLQQFEAYYPTELRDKKLKKYSEPFIGGGAVFFEVMQRFNLENAYISDVNKDLILAYWVVQQQPQQLIEVLAKYQKKYDTTAVEQRNDLFLSISDY